MKSIFFCCFLFLPSFLFSDDGYDLWMKYDPITNPTRAENYRNVITSIYVAGESETCQIIRKELQRGLEGLLGTKIPLLDSGPENGSVFVGTPANSLPLREKGVAAILDTLGNEGFMIAARQWNEKLVTIIAANQEIGLLYGAFHLLSLLQTQSSLQNIFVVSKPRIQYRLLNHWDNLNRSVERGYAGQSLWKWDELPDKVDLRYTDYARANASIGINATVLNNVNANPEILKNEYLKKVAKLADVFRPFGIRVFLSINFSSPISSQSAFNSNRRGGIGDLDTSDPLNPKVRLWWKEKVAEIYRLIPDFGGFLVKANSEGMPGPQDFGRTHADGANMLAEALKPFGGIVMWRAFVYDEDVDPDRAKRAFMEFVPLNGQFEPNVFVQAKNGPIDFQPREPVQPLFGAMPLTPLTLELQITQEYLGHSTHLIYLAPMWEEYLCFDTFARGQGSTLGKIIDGTLHDYSMTGIAGVANTGSDRNWTGHFFGQANWYAFGRLAWDHRLTAAQIADEWIRMSLSREDLIVNTIKSMMLGSWEACVNYMTPLGLHHIMQEGFHYGPQPDLAKSSREDWNSVYYHRADSAGMGFDRSSSGSNATSQYFSPLRDRFDDVSTCPEKYLLWFHHVDWDYPMPSGRTLWEELCFRYQVGGLYVTKMLSQWSSLQGEIDAEIFDHIQKKLTQQQKDADQWQKTCLTYFQKFSNKEIVELDQDAHLPGRFK